jgi:hypothetical protein
MFFSIEILDSLLLTFRTVSESRDEELLLNCLSILALTRCITLLVLLWTD